MEKICKKFELNSWGMKERTIDLKISIRASGVFDIQGLL